MISKLFISASLFFLSGCASNYYTMGTDKYDDEDDFIEATIEKTAVVNRAVLPLSKRLTDRKLIIVFPSKEAISNQSKKNVKATHGKEPNSNAAERLDTLALHSTIMVKSMYEAAKTKGIYSHVSFRETDTISNALAAAADYDTLVWYEESVGLGQWFYSNAKFGKQVFSWDRTSPNLQVNTEAFLSSLQVLAVRE